MFELILRGEVYKKTMSNLNLEIFDDVSLNLDRFESEGFITFSSLDLSHIAFVRLDVIDIKNFSSDGADDKVLVKGAVLKDICNAMDDSLSYDVVISFKDGDLTISLYEYDILIVERSYPIPVDCKVYGVRYDNANKFTDDFISKITKGDAIKINVGHFKRCLSYMNDVIFGEVDSDKLEKYGRVGHRLVMNVSDDVLVMECDKKHIRDAMKGTVKVYLSQLYSDAATSTTVDISYLTSFLEDIDEDITITMNLYECYPLVMKYSDTGIDVIKCLAPIFAKEVKKEM